MSLRSLLTVLAGLKGLVVEGGRIEEIRGEVALVISVRPYARDRSRCGVCQRRCPGYDAGSGRRRWRTLDHATTRCFLEAQAPRVSCPRHGVVVASVPWAAHDAGHTHAFEDQVAWLAMRMSKTAVTTLMRIGWRSVGAVLERVHTRLIAADRAAGRDGLDGLRRIGIDEISYRRGQLFLTVVVDHDTGHLVWAAPGRSRASVHAFFDALGPQRAAQITHVSADQASWIHTVVTTRAPQAVQCADAFHLVQWANKALAVVRAQAWRAARATAAGTRKNGTEQGRQRRDSTGTARQLAHAKHALVKNPENLTPAQHARLDWIAATHPALWEAYRLKEGLRLLLRQRGHSAIATLDDWVDQALNSSITEFAHLATRIEAARPRIEATLIHGLSNALVESTNTKIRLLTRTAYGFHTPQPLIALAMLNLGHHRPTLPGRNPHT